MTNRHFGALDGWRGIAACMVLLVHAPEMLRTPTHIVGMSVVSHSNLFVDFFFVLSGFILTHCYAEKIRGQIKEKLSFFKYFLRRVGRLYPLHISLILISVLLETMRSVFDGTVGTQTGDAFPTGKGGFEFLLDFFLLDGMTRGITPHGSSWNPPAWSISVEIYLNLILFFVLLAQRSKFILVLSLFIPVFAMYFFPDTRHHYILIGTACLSAGALTYYIFKYINNIPMVDGNNTPFRFLIFSVIEILSILMLLIFLNNPPGQENIYSPFIFMVIVLVFSYQGGFLGELLATKVFRAIGAISYSIYLTHWNILITIHTGLFFIDRKLGAIKIIDQEGNLGLSLFQGDLVIFVSTLGVLCFSWATYRFIETPARLWFKNLSEKF